MATERQLHHGHIKDPHVLGLPAAPGASRRVQPASEVSIEEMAVRRGGSQLDCIPGALDAAPPGALRPLSEHPRDRQLYFFCSFGNLNLLPSLAAGRMRLTQEDARRRVWGRGALRPLCDTE